jgi:hypothetical protein
MNPFRILREMIDPDAGWRQMTGLHNNQPGMLQVAQPEDG